MPRTVKCQPIPSWMNQAYLSSNQFAQSPNWPPSDSMLPWQWPSNERWQGFCGVCTNNRPTFEAVGSSSRELIHGPFPADRWIEATPRTRSTPPTWLSIGFCTGMVQLTLLSENAASALNLIIPTFPRLLQTHQTKHWQIPRSFSTKVPLSARQSLGT